MIQATTLGLVVDLRALPGCAQDIATGNLTGNMHLTDLKTLAGGTQYARPGSPVEARQEEVALGNLQRAEEFDRGLGTPESKCVGALAGFDAISAPCIVWAESNGLLCLCVPADCALRAMRHVLSCCAFVLYIILSCPPLVTCVCLLVVPFVL